MWVAFFYTFREKAPQFTAPTSREQSEDLIKGAFIKSNQQRKEIIVEQSEIRIYKDV